MLFEEDSLKGFYIVLRSAIIIIIIIMSLSSAIVQQFCLVVTRILFGVPMASSLNLVKCFHLHATNFSQKSNNWHMFVHSHPL